MRYQFDFHDDPAGFARAAADLLAERPLESTVVATVTARISRDGGIDRDPDAPAPWWVLVRAGGEVVGAAMRVAPFAPFPAYLLRMPGEAAAELAAVLHGRGELIEEINGAAGAAVAFAERMALLAGRSVLARERMSLQEVVEVTRVPEAAGGLRSARAEDLEVVHGWFDAFNADAAEQAGETDPHPGPIETRESTLARIGNGEVWLWEVEGRPVHVTAFNPAQFGVARVGPVYTPKEHRGHGYAAAAVGQISRMLLGTGARVCLFVDEANPTSWALYERLGYRPVASMAHLFVVSR